MRLNFSIFPSFYYVYNFFDRGKGETRWGGGGIMLGFLFFSIEALKIFKRTFQLSKCDKFIQQPLCRPKHLSSTFMLSCMISFTQFFCRELAQFP